MEWQLNYLSANSRLVLVGALACVCSLACDQFGSSSKRSIHEVLVYDQRTSAPIVGATVQLCRDNYSSPPLLVSVTDSKGIAVFQVPKEMAKADPDAVWHEVAWADGYTTGAVTIYYKLVGWYGPKIALTTKTK